VFEVREFLKTVESAHLISLVSPQMSTSTMIGALPELGAEFAFQQAAHLFMHRTDFVIGEGAIVSPVDYPKSKRSHTFGNSLAFVHVKQPDSGNFVDAEARDAALDIDPQHVVRDQGRNIT